MKCDGRGASGESDALPARGAEIGHLDLECRGRKAPVVQRGAAVVGARSAAAVSAEAALQLEPCKKQSLGATTPVPAGKAAGESEDDIILGDVRDNSVSGAGWHRGRLQSIGGYQASARCTGWRASPGALASPKPGMGPLFWPPFGRNWPLWEVWWFEILTGDLNFEPLFFVWVSFLASKNIKV